MSKVFVNFNTGVPASAAFERFLVLVKNFLVPKGTFCLIKTDHVLRQQAILPWHLVLVPKC